MWVVFFICVSSILSIELFFMGTVVGFFQKQFFIKDTFRFLLSSVITTLFLALGYLIGNFSNQFLQYLSHWFAATVLFILGLKMFYQALKLHKAKQLINPLDFRSLIFLSVLSGLNAFFIGLVFGIMQMVNTLMYLSFLIFFSTLLFGYIFGFRLKKLPSLRFEFIVGILYIIIAIFIVINL